MDTDTVAEYILLGDLALVLLIVLIVRMDRGR